MLLMKNLTPNKKYLSHMNRMRERKRKRENDFETH